MWDAIEQKEQPFGGVGLPGENNKYLHGGPSRPSRWSGGGDGPFGLSAMCPISGSLAAREAVLAAC